MRGWLIGGAIGLLAGLWLGTQGHPPASGELQILTNTLVQIKTQDRIVRIPTTAAGVAAVVDEVNWFRTEPGWIRLAPGRIHAGLGDRREWVVDYLLPEPPRWQVGIVAGPGILAGIGQYRFTERLWAGAVLGYGIAAGVVGMGW